MAAVAALLRLLREKKCEYTWIAHPDACNYPPLWDVGRRSGGADLIFRQRTHLQGTSHVLKVVASYISASLNGGHRVSRCCMHTLTAHTNGKRSRLLKEMKAFASTKYRIAQSFFFPSLVSFMIFYSFFFSPVLAPRSQEQTMAKIRTTKRGRFDGKKQKYQTRFSYTFPYIFSQKTLFRTVAQLKLETIPFALRVSPLLVIRLRARASSKKEVILIYVLWWLWLWTGSGGLLAMVACTRRAHTMPTVIGRVSSCWSDGHVCI